MLSRVDERFGFKTPQQPIKLGANTDQSINVLGMMIKKRKISLCTKSIKVFLMYLLQNKKAIISFIKLN